MLAIKTSTLDLDKFSSLFVHCLFKNQVRFRYKKGDDKVQKLIKQKG